VSEGNPAIKGGKACDEGGCGIAWAMTKDALFVRRHDREQESFSKSFPPNFGRASSALNQGSAGCQCLEDLIEHFAMLAGEMRVVSNSLELRSAAQRASI